MTRHSETGYLPSTDDRIGNDKRLRRRFPRTSILQRNGLARSSAATPATLLGGLLSSNRVLALIPALLATSGAVLGDVVSRVAGVSCSASIPSPRLKWPRKL